jgi:hypothetical protein
MKQIGMRIVFVSTSSVEELQDSYLLPFSLRDAEATRTALRSHRTPARLWRESERREKKRREEKRREEKRNTPINPILMIRRVQKIT